MLALDLGVFNRKSKEMKTKEAIIWSMVWVLLSFIFYGCLHLYGEKIHGIENFQDLERVLAQYNQGIKIFPGNFEASLDRYREQISLEFLTGYVVELALSVDNIFVIILIFSTFHIEKKYYHKILFWGILGAIIFRCLFIFIGAYLISHFSWILTVFAVFLIFTGVKMFIHRNSTDEINKDSHPVIKLVSKFWSVRSAEKGEFFIVQNGVRYVTPLFIVLLIVEFTDLVFAVDSIPAIFAVTRDPYIVFFSNIFAILGLRSMFFVLSGAIEKFRFIKAGLSVLLVFIGLKMMFHDWLHDIGFKVGHSLLIILVILLVTIVASLIYPKRNKEIKIRESNKL